MYSVYYHYKLFTRIFHTWRIDAVRQSLLDSKRLAILTVEDRNAGVLSGVISEIDDLKKELDSTYHLLSEERGKRENIQSELKKFFVSKFENLSVEAVEAIDGKDDSSSNDKVLPFVNYVAPSVLKLRN